MSGTQLLRLLVNERLAAAAEEIFGLVEKTIAEYQDEAVRSKSEVKQLKKQLEQLTVLNPEVMLFRAGALPVPEELYPSLQHCDIKVEQIPVLEETEIQELPQVKEEQVEQCISTDMEADTSNVAEARLPKSEPTTNCELFPSSTAVTVSVNESIDEGNESEGSSSPRQSHSVEVVVGLKQLPREEKSCCFCGKAFKRDSFLIRHVDKSHKGFKCLECNKRFEQRYQLVQHSRIHAGEKPFRCDHCDKSFVDNSSCLVHMRQHTGEKPYYCAKCGKRFANSRHVKHCKGTQNKSTKSCRCLTCGKTFHTDSDLKVHMEVHESWKRYLSEKLQGQELEEKT